MGGYGLTIGISADTSEAQNAIVGLQEQAKEFAAGAQAAGESAGAGADKFSESLINAHQSVHLLAEEMGIHLPRAVVSGISEMLPQIENLGNVLLGVFAVKAAAAAARQRHRQALIEEIVGYDRHNEAIRELLANLRKEEEAEERMKRSALDIQLGVRVTKQDLDQLNQVLNIQRGEYKEAAQVTEQYTLAKLLEASAHDLLNESMGGEIASIVQMVAGKRAAAGVEAVYSAAEAAEAYADFFFTGNPQDLAAGIQYTLAAVQYGMVAGSGSNAGGGAGAAAGGAGGLTARAGAGYGYGPGVSSPGAAAGALAPGSAPAPGGQLTVMVMGEPSAAAWLTTNVLNPYVQRGGTLMASTANRVPASGG